MIMSIIHVFLFLRFSVYKFSQRFQNSTSNNGRLNYTISDETVNVSITYTANVWLTSIDNNIEYVFDTKTIDYKKEWDIFGTESLMVSFLFIGTMIFTGIFISAEVGIALTIAGMFIAYYLGFYMVSLSGLMALVVGLIIFLVKIKRR